MSEPMTGGDLTAAFLARAGVDTVFGVISIHNMPILDALARGNVVRFVSARGEAGAANMADAYARVGDRLGVVVTSTGPGAGNAAGALLEARAAGSPVLHLTGQTARPHIGRGRGTVHDVPDQIGMLGAISKAVYRVETPEELLAVLTRAARDALTPPRGPVSVEIPIDIQKASFDRPVALDEVAIRPPDPVPPSGEDLDALADLARTARRPLLWLGNGARHAGDAAARLAGLGFGVVTSMHGRAILPEDRPMTLGAFNMTPEVEAFYATVDLMIVAGSRLRGHETRDFALGLPERRCQIDVDPAANGRSYDCALFVRGDAALALDGLAERLDGRYAPEPGFAADLAAVRDETRARYRDALGSYGALCDGLRAAMPRDAVWVRDITLNNSTWGNRLFPLYAPQDNVYPVAAGIGQGMPLGIGAAFAAAGRKTVAMCGDGGFFLNLGELWTAAQENADIVILVMNDRGYGVIRKIQDAHYGGRHHYDRLDGPDLEGLAGLAGMPFRRVTRVSDLETAMREMLAVAGPALVEVDMTAIGPFPDAALPAAIRPRSKA